MKKYKVFFVDDHPVLRDGLEKTVKEFDHFDSAGVASNGAEAVAAFENGLVADIIVLDLNMPVMDGYAVVEWLIAHRPEVNILVMTQGVPKSKLEFLLGLGVPGIINKDVSAAELLEALESVAEGNIFYSNSVIRDMAVYFQKQQTMKDKKAELKLTESDIEYLKYCGKGLTDKEIGNRMGSSTNAAEQIRVKLSAALNAINRTALVVAGLRMGIIDIEDLHPDK